MRGFQIKLKKGPRGVYLRLADGVREAIKKGHIRSGEFLPSTRSIAEQFGIHRHTVMTALDELISEGWIESVYRKGFKVVATLPDYYLEVPKHTQKTPPLKYGAFKWNLNQGIELPNFAPTTQVKYNFQSGLPDLRLFPIDEFRKHFADSLKRASTSLLDYGDPAGHGPLVIEIKKYLRRLRAIDQREIIITSGSQEAIHLIAQSYLAPGDLVAMEELSYAPAREAFRFAGAKIISLKMDEQGIISDSLLRATRKRKIKLIFITPHHQFPTTCTLNISRRMELYNIAMESGVAILEDDYDHEFHYRSHPLAPMASEDPASGIIYSSTYSKVLFPGARIGYLAVPKALKTSLLLMKRISTHQNDPIMQDALARWMREGGFERHLRRMKRVYEERRNILVAELEDLQARGQEVSWVTPDGGMALWVNIHRNSAEFAGLALSKGVFVHSEDNFTISGKPGTHLRLGFSNLSPKEIRDGIKIIGKILATKRSV